MSFEEPLQDYFVQSPLYTIRHCSSQSLEVEVDLIQKSLYGGSFSKLELIFLYSDCQVLVQFWKWIESKYPASFWKGDIQPFLFEAWIRLIRLYCINCKNVRESNSQVEASLTNCSHMEVMNSQLFITIKSISRYISNINQKHKDNRYTAIHFAAANGCTKMVSFLLEEKHADLNICAATGFTPFQLAAWNSQWHTMEYFLDYYSRMRKQNIDIFLNVDSTFRFLREDYSVLRCLVEDNEVKRASIFIERYSKARPTYKCLRKCFLYCIKHKFRDMLDLLLKHYEPEPAILFFTCIFGDVNMVQQVLPYFQLSKVDNYYSSPFENCRSRHTNTQTCKFFYNDDYPSTILEWCSKYQKWDIVQLLIEKGFSPNLSAQTSPLICAIRQQRMNMLRYLIDIGKASPHPTDRESEFVKSPLYYAVIYGHFDNYEMAKILIWDYKVQYLSEKTVLELAKRGLVDFLIKLKESSSFIRNPKLRRQLYPIFRSGTEEAINKFVAHFGKVLIPIRFIQDLFYEKNYQALQTLRNHDCFSINTSSLELLQDAIASYILPAYQLKYREHYYYSNLNPDRPQNLHEDAVSDYNDRCQKCIKLAMRMGIITANIIYHASMHMNEPAIRFLLKKSFPSQPKSDFLRNMNLHLPEHYKILPIDIFFLQKRNDLVDLVRNSAVSSDLLNNDISEYETEYFIVNEVVRWRDDVEYEIHRISRKGDANALLNYLQGIDKNEIHSIVNLKTKYLNDFIEVIAHRTRISNLFQGRSALEIACIYGHHEVADILLEHGADPAPVVSNTKILNIIYNKRYLNILLVLLVRGCKPEFDAFQVEKILLFTIREKNEFLMKILLSCIFITKKLSKSATSRIIENIVYSGSVPMMKIFMSAFPSNPKLKCVTDGNIETILNNTQAQYFNQLRIIVSYQHKLMNKAIIYNRMELYSFFKKNLIGGMFKLHPMEHNYQISYSKYEIDWCLHSVCESMSPIINPSSLERRSAKLPNSDYTVALERLDESYLQDIDRVISHFPPTVECNSSESDYSTVTKNISCFLFFIFNGLIVGQRTMNMRTKEDILQMINALGDLIPRKLRIILHNRRSLLSPNILSFMSDVWQEISAGPDIDKLTLKLKEIIDDIMSTSLDAWNSDLLSYANEDVFFNLIQSKYIDRNYILDFLQNHRVSDYFVSDAIGVHSADFLENFNIAHSIQVFEANKALIQSCKRRNMDFISYILKRYAREDAIFNEDQILHVAFAFGIEFLLDQIILIMKSNNARISGYYMLQMSEPLPEQTVVSMLEKLIQFALESKSFLRVRPMFVQQLCINGYLQALEILLNYSLIISCQRNIPHYSNGRTGFIDSDTINTCIVYACMKNDIQLFNILMDHSIIPIDLLSTTASSIEDDDTLCHYLIFETILRCCDVQFLKEALKYMKPHPTQYVQRRKVHQPMFINMLQLQWSEICGQRLFDLHGEFVFVRQDMFGYDNDYNSYRQISDSSSFYLPEPKLKVLIEHDICDLVLSSNLSYSRKKSQLLRSTTSMVCKHTFIADKTDAVTAVRNLKECLKRRLWKEFQMILETYPLDDTHCKLILSDAIFHADLDILHCILSKYPNQNIYQFQMELQNCLFEDVVLLFKNSSENVLEYCDKSRQLTSVYLKHNLLYTKEEIRSVSSLHSRQIANCWDIFIPWIVATRKISDSKYERFRITLTKAAFKCRQAGIISILLKEGLIRFHGSCMRHLLSKDIPGTLPVGLILQVLDECVARKCQHMLTCNFDGDLIWKFFRPVEEDIPILLKICEIFEDEDLLVILACTFHKLADRLPLLSIDINCTYNSKISEMCILPTLLEDQKNLMDLTIEKNNEKALYHLIQIGYKHHAIYNHSNRLANVARDYYTSQFPNHIFTSIPHWWNTVFDRDRRNYVECKELTFKVTSEIQEWLSGQLIHRNTGCHRIDLIFPTCVAGKSLFLKFRSYRYSVYDLIRIESNAKVFEDESVEMSIRIDTEREEVSICINQRNAYLLGPILFPVRVSVSARSGSIQHHATLTINRPSNSDLTEKLGDMLKLQLQGEKNTFTDCEVSFN